MSGQDWSDVLYEIDRVKALNAELVAVLEELHDYFDERGYVAEPMFRARAAIAKARGK